MAGIQNAGNADKGGSSAARSETSLLSDTDLSNDEKSVAFIDGWFEDGKSRKLKLERNWFQNIEFLDGRQWVVWDTTTRRYRPEYMLPHRVRYAGNMCSAYVMTRAAKLLKDKPFLKVTPATDEPDDAEISKVSTKVIRYLWDQLKVQGEVLPEFVYSLLLFGTACLKVFYDPTAGPTLPLNSGPEEQLLKDAYGEDTDRRSFALGEAAVESVSPFHLFPDPTVARFDDCKWVLDVRRKTHDEIRELYPDKGRDVQSVDAVDARDHYESRVRNSAGSQIRSFSADSYVVPTSLVKELWVRPCMKYPQGYHVISAGGVVLLKENLPAWCGGKIPYFWLKDKRIPGRMWGGAVFDDLRPINKARNRVVSQHLENANLVANPPIRIPSGSQLRREAVTGKPGAVWKYVPMGPHRPEFVQPATLPDYVKGLPGMLESDAELVTGLNEPTMRASAPSNVRTASGLAALMKMDESRQAVAVNSMNSVLSETGAALLRVVAVSYKEERLARIVGTNDQLSVQRFQGSDLLGPNEAMPGVNYFDVEIRVETGFKSKEALREQLLSYAQVGLVNLQDDTERRWLLRTMDVGAPDDELFGHQTSIESQAHSENLWLARLEDQKYEELKAANVIGPHPWDEDEVHLRLHRSFMQRADFMKLPPEIWIRFQEHVREHEIRMQEAMAMAQPQPAPAGPQGGGQPQAPGGIGSMPGAAEQPRLPEPPKLEHTPFAGIV